MKLVVLSGSWKKQLLSPKRPSLTPKMTRYIQGTLIDQKFYCPCVQHSLLQRETGGGEMGWRGQWGGRATLSITKSLQVRVSLEIPDDFWMLKMKRRWDSKEKKITYLVIGLTKHQSIMEVRDYSIHSLSHTPCPLYAVLQQTADATRNNKNKCHGISNWEHARQNMHPTRWNIKNKNIQMMIEKWWQRRPNICIVNIFEKENRKYSTIQGKLFSLFFFQVFVNIDSVFLALSITEEKSVVNLIFSLFFSHTVWHYTYMISSLFWSVISGHDINNFYTNFFFICVCVCLCFRNFKKWGHQICNVFVFIFAIFFLSSLFLLSWNVSFKLIFLPELLRRETELFIMCFWLFLSNLFSNTYSLTTFWFCFLLFLKICVHQSCEHSVGYSLLNGALLYVFPILLGPRD